MTTPKSILEDQGLYPRNKLVHMAHLFIPGIMMFMGIGFFIGTSLLNPLLLLTLDMKKLRTKSFANFWKFFSKVPASDFPSESLNPVLSSVRGVVLDVGPGIGAHVHRFTTTSSDADVKDRVIWAVEPAEELHSLLVSAAREAGFKCSDDDKNTTAGGQGEYRVIGAGAQPDDLIPALRSAGLLEGDQIKPVFDSIVTIRVLCGVPDPDSTIRGLYGLLKPGGKWIVFEHVLNSGGSEQCSVGGKYGSWASQLSQKVFMMLGWPIWGGGCCLDRDTAGILKRVAKEQGGGWRDIQLSPRNPWSTVPEVYGILTKKG